MIPSPHDEGFDKCIFLFKDILPLNFKHDAADFLSNSGVKNWKLYESESLYINFWDDSRDMYIYNFESDTDLILFRLWLPYEAIYE